MPAAGTKGGAPGIAAPGDGRPIVVLVACADEAEALAATLDTMTRRQVLEPEYRVVALPADGHGAIGSLEAAVAGHPDCTFSVRHDRCPLAPLRDVAAAAPGTDLIYVRAGILVPWGWDARLRAAANSVDTVAAASPTCDTSRVFAVAANPRGDYDGAQVAGRDARVYTVADGAEYSAPFPYPGCFYARGPALEAVADTGEWWRIREPAPAVRALTGAWHRLGLDTVLADHIHVGDGNGGTARAAASLDETPEAEAFRQVHALGPLRRRLAEHAADPGGTPVFPQDVARPLILHITHSWGGGISHWIRDFIEADPYHQHIVLCSFGVYGAFGRRLVLYAKPGDDQPIRQWFLGRPIAATATRHARYRQVVSQLVDEYGVSAVYVSSLIGHSLDVFELGLPTALVCHDYYPFCPALNITFGGTCRSCDRGRLQACFEENPHNRFFSGVGVDDWLELRGRYREVVGRPHVTPVAPSESVKRSLGRLVPELAERGIRVIKHGIEPPAAAVPPPASWARPRLVVPGRLTEDKGLALFSAIVDRLLASAEVHLLGPGDDGDAFADREGVYIHPPYPRAELGERLAAIRPDLALLLSVVPETFSYTLSELMALQVPVLATRLGAFADRIQDGRNGFLADPVPEAVAGRVEALIGDRAGLDRVRRRLGQVPVRTRRAMVDDYRALLPLAPFSAARYLPGRPPAQPGGGIPATFRDEAGRPSRRPPLGVGRAIRALWAMLSGR